MYNTAIRLLILLLFVLFPFGQLTRISLAPSISLYVHDMVIGLVLALWGLSHIWSHTAFDRSPLLKPIAYFSGVTLISLLANMSRFDISEVLVGSLYLVRWIVYSGLYFVVHEQVAQKNIKPQTILKGLLFAGSVSGLFGLIQYTLYPNLRNMIYLGWDPHEYRVFGTFFDSGYLGIILVLTLILCIFRWKEHKVLRRPFIALLTIVTYIAFAFTYSRSSYLAFLAGVSSIYLLKNSWKLFAVAVVTLGITMYFLPRPSPTSEGVKLERTSTVNARLVNYQQSWDIITDNPVSGVGFNTLRYYKRDHSLVAINEWETNHAGAGLDNSLLFVWATAGTFGLAAYLYLWYSALRQILQGFKSSNTTPLSMVTLVSITAIAAHSLFLNTLFYPWIMIWYWLLLGIIAPARSKKQTGNR